MFMTKTRSKCHWHEKNHKAVIGAPVLAQNVGTSSAHSNLEIQDLSGGDQDFGRHSSSCRVSNVAAKASPVGSACPVRFIRAQRGHRFAPLGRLLQYIGHGGELRIRSSKITRHVGVSQKGFA